jgi:hypothetical protein
MGLDTEEVVVSDGSNIPVSSIGASRTASFQNYGEIGGSQPGVPNEKRLTAALRNKRAPPGIAYSLERRVEDGGEVRVDEDMLFHWRDLGFACVPIFLGAFTNGALADVERRC